MRAIQNNGPSAGAGAGEEVGTSARKGARRYAMGKRRRERR